MIGHAVNGKHLCMACLHKSGDVLMEFFFVFLWKKALPSLNSKDKLEVKL